MAFVGLKICRNKISIFFPVGGILALIGYFYVNQWAWTFIGVGRIAGVAIFFIIGMAYGHWRDKIEAWLGKWWIGSIFASLWLGLFHAENIIDGSQLICSLVGIGMLISLSLLICEWPLGWNHLEGYNYMMYLLSWFTCVISQQVLHYFTDFPWWTYTFIALLTSIYVPWSIGKLLHRTSSDSIISRKILFLLGHNPNKYVKSH